MIIDTNVYLSRWPFRRLAGDEPEALVAKLRQRNVAQAWAGSFDGMLHRDIGGVNLRLAQACRDYGQGMLVPFGSLNPKLPDWHEDLRRCQEEHKMAGIRLHPNYHGYRLDDPVFAELLKLATACRLIVQLALCMEDERTQSPLMRVSAVDITPLAGVVKLVPGLRLELLNCHSNIGREEFRSVLAAGDVYAEISMVEGVAGVGRLVHESPPPRMLFGSYYPFFDFESALLKLQESGLDEASQKAICEDNARRLMARRGSPRSARGHLAHGEAVGNGQD
ncbi:MAG TPA: amidohydrolase family protein [Terriglobia bacterium]|nr:amidohydrolase family protein [Terriglobia bacterium]